MRKTYLLLAVLLLAVAGICVMLWPAFTGHRLQADTDAAVQSFLKERKPEQQYPELLAALQEYNRPLDAEKQCNLTDLEACEEPAADLTVYGIEDEVIGVLEIPTMELTMPVYLGASDEHLALGAAVLGNTSAPIGGDNTNCVIAGHRGWRGADYFRHIDRESMGNADLYRNGHSDHPAPRGGQDQDTARPRPADAVDLPSLRQRWAGEVCGVLRKTAHHEPITVSSFILRGFRQACHPAGSR